MILYYILVALTPFLNPPLVWLVLGSSGTFKILGALCVIYTMFDVVHRGSVPGYFHTWQERLFAVLFVFAFFSFLIMSNGGFLQNTTLLTYLDFVVFFFVTIALVSSVRRLRWVLLAAVVGIAYGSADIIREWLQMHGSNPWFRAGDVVGDGNYFSTSAALILPFVFLMIFNSRQLLGKLYFLGCLLLTLAAIVLTGSRGGALAVATSFLYVIWHSPHRARNFALVSVLALPFLVLVPVSPLYRLLHPVNQWNGINTEQTRLDAWVAGLKMFETHPLFGVGVGNFKTLMPQYAAPGVQIDTIAHNTYIEYLAEMGPAGLLLFLAITFCAFHSLRKVRKRTRGPGPPSLLYLASLSLESGILGYMVGAFFLSAEYEKLLWVVIFLSACLPDLVQPLQPLEPEAMACDTSLVNTVL